MYRRKKRRKNKTREYAPPRYFLGGALKKLLPTAVGAATSFIPGAGPALAPVTAGLTESLVNSGGSKKGQRRRVRKSQPINYAESSYGYRKGGDLDEKKSGGKLQKLNNKGAGKYVGPRHEQGGIPVNEDGTPTSPNTADAEVEGGETKQGDYIFSDTLKVPGTDLTFAQAHERLIANEAGDERIQRLMQMQEKAQNNGGEKGAVSQQNQQARQAQAQGTSGEPVSVQRGDIKGGGKLPEYQNGGWANGNPENWEQGERAIETSVSYAGTDPNTEGDTGFSNILSTAADVAGYVVPSAVDLSIANQYSEDIEPTPKVDPKELPVQSRAFNESKNEAKAAYRSILDDPAASQNQKLAAYSQYLKSRGDISSREAEFRQRQERANVDRQYEADVQNVRGFQTDRELQAKEDAARAGLVRKAITQPITQYRADQAGKDQQIASIVTSASGIQNPQDRRETIRMNLRAIGISDQRINEILREQGV